MEISRFMEHKDGGNFDWVWVFSIGRWTLRHCFNASVQRADSEGGMKLAMEIVIVVTDVGAVMTQPEMKLDLCNLVARTCLQINTVERKNKTCSHLVIDDPEWEELLQIDDSFHARGEV
eukprot:4639646-Amphidinium_carterae.1